jgi:hypothetical protein
VITTDHLWRLFWAGLVPLVPWLIAWQAYRKATTARAERRVLIVRCCFTAAAAGICLTIGFWKPPDPIYAIAGLVWTRLGWQDLIDLREDA